MNRAYSTGFIVGGSLDGLPTHPTSWSVIDLESYRREVVKQEQSELATHNQPQADQYRVQEQQERPRRQQKDRNRHV